MAQRYQGDFSPKKDPPNPSNWHNRQPVRAGARVNFLFLLPLPLAIRAFTFGPAGMAQTLVGLGLLMLAAWLTRDGVLAHQAFDARKVARRPAIPRKLFGSALTAGGLFAAVFAEAQNIIEPAIYAIVGAALHVLAFGPDPLRNKGMEGIDTFQQDRVAKAVSEAERHLSGMMASIERTGDRKLLARVESFSDIVRNMARTVEEDPRDLTAARRYLGVYLLGARDAAEKYATLHQRSADKNARAEFEGLLDDLEHNFLTKTDGFLQNDKTDLTIEIDVLRERLEREKI